MLTDGMPQDLLGFCKGIYICLFSFHFLDTNCFYFGQFISFSFLVFPLLVLEVFLPFLEHILPSLPSVHFLGSGLFWSNCYTQKLKE